MVKEDSMTGKAKKIATSKGSLEANQSVAVQSWLAEFQALRDEILFRMRNADYFLIINVGAIGTILTLALTIKEIERTMLVIPFISCFLGLMYFNQLRHVQMLGRYIQNVIVPALSAECDNVSVMGWEVYHRSKKSEWSVIPGWGLINILAFIVPSVAAVILTLQSSIVLPTPLWIKLVWGIGLLLNIGLIWVWYREEKYVSV